MNRRQFLRGAAASATAAYLSAPTRAADSTRPVQMPPMPPLTPVAEVQARVRAARPLLGGVIPADLSARLGTTHYDGKYSFGDQPYIVQGCEAVLKLGMRAVKLWLGPKLPGYSYHSPWGLPPDARLVDVARHPYFAQCFAMPFAAFSLEVFPVAQAPGRDLFSPAADVGRDEAQFYELAKHLLTTYRDRDVTFVLQNWEGDWMIRGEGTAWHRGGPPDAVTRLDAFARWLSARQAGVSRARAEVGPTRCRVCHAAEVRTVLDTLAGIPTMVSHVLPQVSVDRVSWSCYDGAGNAQRLWHGLDLIHHFARPAPDGSPPPVFVGEVGLPERGLAKPFAWNWWDVTMGVLLARDVPLVFHWELYCNEPMDGHKADTRPRTAEQLRGFWLIRPDGSLGYAAQYLTALLAHAGGTLPPDLRSAGA